MDQPTPNVRTKLTIVQLAELVLEELLEMGLQLVTAIQDAGTNLKASVDLRV